MAIVWSCVVSVHVLLFGLQCGGLGKVVIGLFFTFLCNIQIVNKYTFIISIHF